MPTYVANETFEGRAASLVFGSGYADSRPSMARLTNGGFVTVEVILGSVVVRIFDVNGQPIATQTLASTSLADPSVTALPNGGFAVAWTASDGSLSGIFMRTFSASGVAEGAVVPVNSATVGSQQQPFIEVLAGGDIAVAWTDNGTNGVSNVMLRVFNAEGVAVTAPIAITNYQFANSGGPFLEALANGEFVIGWTGPQSGSSYEVNLQLVSSAYVLQPLSFSTRTEFSGPSFHDAYFGSLAVLSSGEMIVTWTDNGPNGVTVRGQRLDASGQAIGLSFQIGASGVVSGQASVTALDNSGFMVTWRTTGPTDGANYYQQGDVVARIYDANANPVGAAFMASSSTVGGQDLPVAVQFGTGDIGVAFRSFTSNGTPQLTLRTFYSVTTGTDFFDTMVSTDGVDVFRGLDGGDLITIGLRDSADGGLGTDTLRIDYSASSIELTLGLAAIVGGGSTVLNGGSISDMEYVDLIIGSPLADSIITVTQPVTLTINGGDGDDSVNGSGSPVVFNGGHGDDIFTNGSAPISFDGGAGADTLSVFGNASVASLSSIEALAVIAGSTLTLTGAQFASGFAANTILWGSGSIIVDITAGTAFSASGMTLAGGASVVFTVNGSVSNDTIKAFLHRGNTINADDGNDQVRGGLHIDTISGGNGNDKIVGYGSADIMTGGAGADQFRYLFAGDSGTGANADRITDFLSGTDRLNFALLDADPVAAGRQALTYIDTAAFTATGTAQVRYGVSGADLLVQVDLDGNGSADMEIVLLGAGTQVLTGGDFML